MISSLPTPNRAKIAWQVIRTGRRMLMVIFTATALTACAQTSAKAAGLETGKIKVGGAERTYSIYIAPSCVKATADCPILLGFHGGGVRGVSGKQFEKFGDWVTAAQRRKVILVFPDALNRNWNDGRAEVGNNVDDVGFVRALIAQVRRDNRGADRVRVYATGISNGGHLSYRLACEMPETITAIAPVAASLSVALTKRCAPATPVSILNILGEQDPISPYGGGKNKGGRGSVTSAAETLAFWQKANGCMGDARVTINGTVTTRSFDRCNGQVQLRQLSIADGGHTWPGHPVAPFLTRFIGKTSMAFDATAMILDFFGIDKEGI